MRKLEERWNPSYALEWDNVGLLVGREEKEIKKINGDLIVVHAQVRICPFYEKQGYIQFGQIDDDEGVPHMWMKKKIQY